MRVAAAESAKRQRERDRWHVPEAKRPKIGLTESLLGVKESDLVPISELLAVEKIPSPVADFDFSDETPSRTPSCSSYFPPVTPRCDSIEAPTPRTSAHNQLSQALDNFQKKYPGYAFEDPLFQNAVKNLGKSLVEVMFLDQDWLPRQSSYPAELHSDVSGTRFACNLPLSTIGSLSVSLLVLPSDFISHITRKDNADTVYLCLRGMISLKRQGIESGVYSAVLSNISERLTQQQFIDYILESTGVKVKSVHFRPFFANKLSAMVNFESKGDFQKVAAIVRDEKPFHWNADMPLFVTAQTAVYSQTVQYGEIEAAMTPHLSANVDASSATSTAHVLTNTRVMCSEFSQCLPVDRSELQPAAHCFVPATSLHSFCSETSSLLLSIQFIKDHTTQQMSADQLQSLDVQTRYFWSAIPSWKPHQFMMRAGNETTTELHYSSCERPVVRRLDISHSELKPFLDQAHAQLANCSMQSSICNVANMRMFSEVLEARMRQLDANLRDRPEHQLVPEDSALVFDIGYALARKISEGRLLDDRRRVEMITNMDDIVLWRYFLFDTPHLQIRLHLWSDASETYIHNHRTNFLALGFTGEYTHRTFVIEDGQDSTYKTHTRDGSGDMREPEIMTGCVKLSSEFKHGCGHVYYLHNRAYHAVSLPNSARQAPKTKSPAAAGGHMAERTQNRCLDCAGKGLQCSSCVAAERVDAERDRSSCVAAERDRSSCVAAERDQRKGVEGQGPEYSPMLTLFVKDKVNNPGTKAIEVMHSIEGVDRTPPAPVSGAETELHGEMKKKVLESIERHLGMFLKNMGEAPSPSASSFANLNRLWNPRGETLDPL